MPKSSTRDPETLRSFEKIKKLLQEYAPPLVSRGVKTDKPQYHLWSFRSVLVAGRTKKEVYFAGAVIQKDYVGFYYMPIYTHAAIRQQIPAELLKSLKGKSCFYIRDLSPILERQIRKILKVGFCEYQKQGWI